MTRKTIVILQSNYIPWKGYFDLIAVADEFLLFDEVQFTKNDWRNRNRIVLDGRLHWLTLPVRTAGEFGAAIDRIEVSRPDWAKAHWATIRQAYRHAPYHGSVAPVIEEAYASANIPQQNQRIPSQVDRDATRPGYVDSSRRHCAAHHFQCN